jgi:hypothetical protein
VISPFQIKIRKDQSLLSPIFGHCSRYRESLVGRWVGWISDSASSFNSFADAAIALFALQRSFICGDDASGKAQRFMRTVLY